MKFARKVRYVRAIVVWGVLAALAPSVVEAADKPTKQQLIERGRELFTKETFDGNGRTCATCHPATNNFTIDPASSRSCPRATDGSPDDGSMRQFAAGAVVQHLTKTLNRVEGVDFRLPTKAELDALEAFQRSLGRQEEVDLAALTFVDDAAQRGKDLFEGVGVNRSCTQCHANAGANVVDDEKPDEAFNDNFDTGTRQLGTGPAEGGFGQDHQNGVPGFGNGTINTPPLIEAADTAPFFHNNSAATLEDSIRFYTTPTFAKSPSGGTRGAFVLNKAAIADIATFLRALNARENAHSAFVGVVDARRERNNSELLQAVAADVEDGIEVLEASKLAPDAVAAFEDAARLIADAATRPEGLGEAQGILGRIPPLIAVENETVAGN